MLNPLRKVTKGRIAEGTTGLLLGNKGRWYELHLECGHMVERRARYKPIPNAPRGWACVWGARKLTDVLPFPKRARCDYCKE